MVARSHGKGKGSEERDPAPSRPPRYPAIARSCLHLDWIFLLFWALYLAGPDVFGYLHLSREGVAYRWFAGLFFVLHFALVTTGIIALWIVIIDIYGRRPVRGLRSVLVALTLPILSFLYFAIRFLAQVRRWPGLEH